MWYVKSGNIAVLWSYCIGSVDGISAHSMTEVQPALGNFFPVWM